MKAARRREQAGPRTDAQRIIELKKATLHSGPLLNDPDMDINFEYITPGVDSQLRGLQEAESGNPLMIKSEEAASFHSDRVAAHRWNLIITFASTQIIDAIRQNARADQALPHLFNLEDLRQV